MSDPFACYKELIEELCFFRALKHDVNVLLVLLIPLRINQQLFSVAQVLPALHTLF